MVHDFVTSVGELKKYRHSFVLSPEMWRRFGVPFRLDWNRVKFDSANKAQIPNTRGIYAFIVQHDNANFPPHGYIMYVGIAGAYAENRTLNDRFLDYIRERDKGKRPKIRYMLNQYPDDLYFHFAPVEDREVDLKVIESALNDALIPPMVQNDFSAEVRPLVSAMRDA